MELRSAKRRCCVDIFNECHRDPCHHLRSAQDWCRYDSVQPSLPSRCVNLFQKQSIIMHEFILATVHNYEMYFNQET